MNTNPAANLKYYLERRGLNDERRALIARLRHASRSNRAPIIARLKVIREKIAALEAAAPRLEI